MNNSHPQSSSRHSEAPTERLGSPSSSERMHSSHAGQHKSQFAPQRTTLPWWQRIIGGVAIGAVLVLLFLLLGNDLLPGMNNAGNETLFGSTAATNPVAAQSIDELSQIVQAANVAPPGTLPGAAYQVGPRFAEYYRANGGVRSFGLPLGDPMIVNGREIQWFERTRLEHWPEFAGTAYEIQPGLLGIEYTSDRDFPRQEFFVSRPDQQYFPETGQAVGGAFLRYWQANGSLARFGLPISPEFAEAFPDGSVYRVQYFQRARLEYHPEFAGTPDEIMVGLLGTALVQHDARPQTVPPAPTTVPLP